MLPLLKLINSHFWKSIFGPFFAFIFPLIFVGIIGTISGSYNDLGGFLAVSATAVALTAMPQAIFEFKRSSLLKRIGVTPIKPWMFVLIAGIFYSIIMVVGTFIVLGLSIGIFSQYLNVGKSIVETQNQTVLLPPLVQYFQNINWGSFLYGTIMNIMIGVSMGMLLVSVSKSSLALQGIGIPVLIISIFLSAQVLPIAAIKNIEPIWYMTYISPFKYSTSLMIESWANNISSVPALISGVPGTMDHLQFQYQILSQHNIFDVSQTFSGISFGGKFEEIYGKGDNIANLVMPYIFTLGFAGLSVKFFKWSTR